MALHTLWEQIKITFYISNELLAAGHDMIFIKINWPPEEILGMNMLKHKILVQLLWLPE